jgi:hypothetical protein
MQPVDSLFMKGVRNPIARADKVRIEFAPATKFVERCVIPSGKKQLLAQVEGK